MLYGILGSVYGNTLALRAVLSAMKQQGVREVSYDVEQAAQEILDAGLPPSFAYRLRHRGSGGDT